MEKNLDALRLVLIAYYRPALLVFSVMYVEFVLQHVTESGQEVLILAQNLLATQQIIFLTYV